MHGLTAIANGTGLRYRGSRSVTQENHRGHEYPACFRKQEVETQMHTDKKGYTRMVRLHRMWANVGSANTLHLRASLLIRVYLRFPLLC